MLFLTYDQILELHESILIPANPRGQSEERVRAIMGNIAGGIGEQLFHTTVLEAGNAYLYYFARDQAFVKGNKRTAVITCWGPSSNGTESGAKLFDIFFLLASG